MNESEKIKAMVGTSVLTALVIILQLFASSVKIGPFSITLALIPIVLGAFLYGPKVGMFLGFAFGVIVSYAVITGIDIGGNIMFQENAVATILACLLKSTFAGYASGAIYKLFNKKNMPGIGLILGAIACPVINTGILVIAMITIFNELISSWAISAGSKSTMGYVITGIVGVNFLIEIVINIILSPVIFRIINIFNKEK